MYEYPKKKEEQMKGKVQLCRVIVLIVAKYVS